MKLTIFAAKEIFRKPRPLLLAHRPCIAKTFSLPPNLPDSIRQEVAVFQLYIVIDGKKTDTLRES